VADDLELRREGPSYTVDTVAQLHEERPGDELVLIVGSDTLPELPSWKDHDRLRRMCTVAVVTRPEDGRADAGDGGAEAAGLRRVPGPGLPVSATEIRRRVKEGRSVRYLVPDARGYIAKRGLYR
jgi:nicotinate-nucleotide adenylyltransferase